MINMPKETLQIMDFQKPLTLENCPDLKVNVWYNIIIDLREELGYFFSFN